MAFEEAQSDIPTYVGDITITLVTNGEGTQNAFYHAVILSQGDVPMEEKAGDLIPHITVGQRQALIAFMESIREQAEDQFLPGTGRTLRISSGHHDHSADAVQM